MENKIPQQHTGGHSDTLSKVELNDIQAAKQHFETVKKRFLDVNNWGKFAGAEKAEFRLYNASGTPKNSTPEKGDYFRINIPGPGNPTGEGDDWVQVEEIKEEKESDTESAYIRVRPCASPLNEKSETAHFFGEKATSNFIIKRVGQTVSAEVHGRNEEPNTEDVGLIEKIRNAVVAIGGMLLGSKIQWKGLTDGLVALEDENR